MSFLKIWIYFLSLGVCLLPFRSDGSLIMTDIVGMLFSNRIIGFVFSATLLFLFLPFTVPYSIANIINKNKK